MNCIYCLKEYTFRGIKKHHSFCKVKKEVEHQKKYDDEKIKINCDEYKVANKNDYLNNIPEDCLRVIFDFYNGKDEFTTSKRVCRNLFRVAVTCKRLYKIFKPPISLYKSHLVELKNKLYQTYAKKIYKLTDKDIECVKCENKYMYQTNCKLYLTVDILDKCLDKYGSHENFENILKLKKIKKEKSEIKVSLLKENRRIKYNNLFIKYDLLHGNTYYEFFDYIQYGTPSLSIIEEELNHIIDKRERYKLLYSLLNNNNLTYESTNIVDDYINTNKYSLEEAYQTIFEINKKKKDLVNFYNEYKIDAWANINNSYTKKYVYENLYNYDEICKIIIGRHTRISSLKTILKTFNVKIKNDNILNIELFKKYIDEGGYYIEAEKELDQNNYPQIIVEKYVNENERTELLIKEFKNKNIKYYIIDSHNYDERFKQAIKIIEDNLKIL